MKIFFSILIFLTSNLLAAGFSDDDTSLAGNYYETADTFIKKAQYDSALFYLEKAEKIFHDNEMWNKYVGSLNKISHSLRGLGNYDSALVISKNALQIGMKNCKDNKIVAQVYNQLGYIYKNLGDFDSAFLNALKGEIILESHSPNEIQAENYSLLGQIEKEKSEYDSSLYFFERSIETKTLVREDDPSISTEYNNIALTLEEKGDHEKALEYFFKSLNSKINSLGEKHADVATIYNNIGANYFYRGENDLALEYYLKGLSIDLELLKKDHPSLGSRYNNIAMAYRAKGDFEKAIEYAFKSKEIMLKNFGAKHPNYAVVINNIGRIYSDKKKYDKALEFFISSYEIFKDLIGESHPVTAQIQNNIGETYTKMGDYDKGLEYLKKSLLTRVNSLGFKHPKVAITLTEIGKNYYYQGFTDSALYYFQQAAIAATENFNVVDLNVNPNLSSRRYDQELLEALFLKAETFNKKYSVSDNLTDLKNSLETYKFCSKLAVEIRQSYKSESSKFSIGKTGYNIILGGISVAKKLYDISGNQSYLETAFELAEKDKAGILSDALAEANAKKFSGIPDSLLKKERQLRIDLTSYDNQIQKEKEKKKGIDSIKLKKLEDSFFTSHRKYEDLIGYFEKNNHEYYQLKYRDQDYSSEKIKRDLNNRSAILEYVISDSILYVFSITKKEKSITRILLNNPLDNDVISFRNALNNIDFENYVNTANKLYSILIKPVENKIKNIEKLYIIPDGILNYLPFESLLTDKRENDFDFSKMDYLIRKYEISYYFSASTLHDIKQHRSNTNKSFAGFAPVFADKNSQLEKKTENHSTVAQLKRAIEINDKTYSELPETKHEVEGILDLFRKKKLPGLDFISENAKEEIVKSETMKNYSFLHIATHGFMNEEKPRFSGVIFTNRNNSPGEDGVLYSEEIYNLNLNADLVVLSACESGLGKIVKGEGLIGLTRGFIYSGARNIVVSLWQVADKSTSNLMIEFYKNILNGKNFPSSLREAKLKLIKDGTYSYPLEWSPFVLIGK